LSLKKSGVSGWTKKRHRPRLKQREEVKDPAKKDPPRPAEKKGGDYLLETEEDKG